MAADFTVKMAISDCLLVCTHGHLEVQHIFSFQTTIYCGPLETLWSCFYIPISFAISSCR